MKLWRITTKKWALDTICDGAKQYGGRWNPIGYPAMYAGTTIEICALEKFVHLNGAMHPPLMLVSIEVPDDDILFTRPLLEKLPKNWSALPGAAGAQEFGRQWLESAQQLVMFLPSAIIPEATNALINPKHARYRELTLTAVREFTFDARMFKIG